MAVRSDVDMLWYLSPRVLMVREPSVDITIQDIHDTLRSLEDSPDGEGEDLLIDSAGKDALGGGVTVGITATLLNTKLAFAPRHVPVTEGQASTADPTGTSLIDSSADFIADGIAPGNTIVNHTDKSSSTILRVVSATELYLHPLDGGTDNDWDIGDVYGIYAVAQCLVTGGNLVAVDALGVPINPIFSTSFTQVNIAASSSATLIQASTFKAGISDTLPFELISVTTRLPQAGFTVTAERLDVDGVTWIALNNSVVDLNGGNYSVALDGEEVRTGRNTYRFSGANFVTRTITVYAA